MEVIEEDSRKLSFGTAGVIDALNVSVEALVDAIKKQ